MADFSNTEQWHYAAGYRQTARGVYLCWIDVGDEVEPHTLHWAAATPGKARAWIRRQARGRVFYVDQHLNPHELVFGYILRRHYRAQLTPEELESHELEMAAAQAARPLEAVRLS